MSDVAIVGGKNFHAGPQPTYAEMQDHIEREHEARTNELPASDCSPIELLKEIAARDAEATRVLAEMIPGYESEPDYLDLQRRIKECIEANEGDQA